jgi:hypothetical protein
MGCVCTAGVAGADVRVVAVSSALLGKGVKKNGIEILQFRLISLTVLYTTQSMIFRQILKPITTVR